MTPEELLVKLGNLERYMKYASHHWHCEIEQYPGQDDNVCTCELKEVGLDASAAACVRGMMDQLRDGEKSASDMSWLCGGLIADRDKALARIRELEAEVAGLKLRKETLEADLPKTLDDKFIRDCAELYCPECGRKVRQEYDICYCDDCPNPDDYGLPPLPLSYTRTYAEKPQIKGSP